MKPFDSLNIEQKEAIKKLRLRMKNDLPSSMENSLTLYRFLKARDFDIDKAEVMLRKSITWRKAVQLEVLLDSFEYCEVFKKYISISLLGFDKEGEIVLYIPSGKLELKDILKCMKMNDLFMHFNICAERFLKEQEKENEKTGKFGYQLTCVLDLDKLTFSNATSRLSAELFLKTLQILQDNYPERLKSCYVINAPSYSVWIYTLVKGIISRELNQKIRMFGQNGWKKALLEVIDPDVLPAFLGGNRTDPDGDPLCPSFVVHGGKFPSKYYLTNEQRWFKNSSQVKKLVVLPMQSNKVLINVAESGSVIEWEFESRNKDIGFGLFYKELEKEIEVLPIIRHTSSDGTETGYYTAQWVGTYIVIFDNSYSRFSSKEVRYCIIVTKPRCG